MHRNKRKLEALSGTKCQIIFGNATIKKGGLTNCCDYLFCLRARSGSGATRAAAKARGSSRRFLCRLAGPARKQSSASSTSAPSSPACKDVPLAQDLRCALCLSLLPPALRHITLSQNLTLSAMGCPRPTSRIDRAHA